MDNLSKKIITGITLVFIILIGVGTYNYLTETNETTYGDVKEEVAEAAETTLDFGEDKKDNLIASLEDERDHIDKKIEQLKENLVDVKNDAKKGLKKKINSLEDEQAKLDNKIDKLKKSTDKVTDDVAKGIKKAQRDIKETIQDIENEFKNNKA